MNHVIYWLYQGSSLCNFWYFCALCFCFFLWGGSGVSRFIFLHQNIFLYLTKLDRKLYNHGLSLSAGGDVKQITAKNQLSDMIEVWLGVVYYFDQINLCGNTF